MKAALTLLLVTTLTACASKRELLPNTEYVLSPGMKISADTPHGQVEILAGHGTERIFSGEGWIKKRVLIRRTTRWYGSLGLYDPAGSDSPHGRLLADEGRLFFESESDALRYLYVGSDVRKPVFTNRGLVVAFTVAQVPGGEPTRTVQVWQIYINGKRPPSLRGANDAAIKIEGGEILETATPNAAPVGYAITLGAREYVPEKD